MPTAQPRKAAAKKAPAKKATAAVRARREVRSEKTKVQAVKVNFRDQDFEIAPDRLGSARVFLREQHIRQFGATVTAISAWLFEILGQRDAARFIDLCKPGDTIDDTAAEFMDALNKAANVPNS